MKNELYFTPQMGFIIPLQLNITISTKTRKHLD